jgi:methionyl-tRNA formyltransferase
MVKILKCKPHPGEPGLKPGESSSDQKSYWHIGTHDGYIAVEELQWEGKRRIDVKSFLLGNTI